MVLIYKEWEAYLTIDLFGALPGEVLIAYMKVALTERQYKIMASYYGIDVERKSMTQIGDEMGLTRARIHQIVSKSLRITRNIIAQDKNWVTIYRVKENLE